jgi:hypothetical protein
MVTLTFRVLVVGDQIFLICSLKNHMTFFLAFLVKILELNFLESPAENIENATFIFSKMSFFCFFALVYTLNHNFCNETMVWEKSIKAVFNQEFKKNISPKLAKLDKM